jgi:hypothetical protein
MIVVYHLGIILMEPTQPGSPIENTTPAYSNPYEPPNTYGLPELSPPPPPPRKSIWKVVKIGTYFLLALVALFLSFVAGTFYSLSTHPQTPAKIILSTPITIQSTPIIKTVVATPLPVPTYISFGETAVELFQNIHGIWYTTIKDFTDQSYAITFYGRDPDILATTAINFLNSSNNKQQYLAEPPTVTSGYKELCYGAFANGVKWEVDGQYADLFSDNTCSLLQSLN